MAYFSPMNILKELFSLIVPTECIGCSLLGEIVCLQCSKDFRDTRKNPPIFIFGNSRNPRIAGHLPYNEVVGRIVLGAKDDGNRQLERIVINSLVAARSLFPPNLLLVPIPSHKRAKRKRGRDFTLFLAREVSRISGDQVAPWLTFSRMSAPQKNLNARARAMNMTGALTIADHIRKKSSEIAGDIQTLVLDDVLTTGATMREAIRALTTEGVPCLGGISAAYSLNWSMGQPSH